MKLFAKKGVPRVPWEVWNPIFASGRTDNQKSVMIALALASSGYRAKFANVSLYEIAKFLGKDRHNLRRTVEGLIKLGLVTFLEVGKRRLYGLKYVSDYYEKYPNQMLGAYKVPGDYMLESGRLRSAEMKGAKKIGALIDKDLGKPKRRGKKELEINPSESYFLERDIKDKARREGLDPNHVIDSCVGVT